MAAALAAVLVAPGEQRALLMFGAVTTFWQPVQAVLAAGWRGGIPPERAGRLPAVAANTALMLLGAGLLTLAAQALVARFAPGQLLAVPRTSPGQGPVMLGSFPVLIPLGALLFVAFLQLPMVCEQRPFTRLPPHLAGWTALATVAALTVPGYLLLVNWNSVPVTVRAATGLRNPGGPVAALDLATWLILVAAWQVLVMNLASGWPASRLSRPALRITVNNLLVLGGASLTLAALSAAGLPGPTISALGGATVGGVRITTVLFGPWSARRVAGVGRVALAALGLLTAAAVLGLLELATRAQAWTTAPAQLWVAVAGLNLVAGTVSYVTGVLGLTGADGVDPPQAPAASGDAELVGWSICRCSQRSAAEPAAPPSAALRSVPWCFPAECQPGRPGKCPAVHSAVAFEIELALEGVVDRFDLLPDPADRSVPGWMLAVVGVPDGVLTAGLVPRRA